MTLQFSASVTVRNITLSKPNSAIFCFGQKSFTFSCKALIYVAPPVGLEPPT